MSDHTQDAKQVFELICQRITGYSSVKRSTPQPTRIADILKIAPDYKFDPNDDAIREPDLEHVGSLPVIATTIHPYLQRDDVNLGDALIMLAVHDIGELVMGDTMMFVKTKEQDEEEYKAALKILEPTYHELYDRIENSDPSDPTSRFAKCIDKLAGDIFDYLTPREYVLKRYAAHANIDSPDEIIKRKLEFKSELMAWDPRMEALFKYGIERQREKLAEV